MTDRNPIFHHLRAQERQTISHVDGIAYVSAWARDALLEWMPEAACLPSLISPNFVSEVSLATQATPRRDLVSIGGIDYSKNHSFLLNVIAEAKRRGRDLTLDIFGSGRLEQELVAQATTLGISTQVRLMGFQRDVRARLSDYRVYVHASLTESFGISLIEAMAAGLPIVAGRTGAIPELFTDGCEGVFWPLDDAGRACDVLLSILDNPPVLSAMRQAARQRFLRAYSTQTVAPRLLAFLQGDMPMTLHGEPPLRGETSAPASGH
jgi:glycosyltransferase involved in cell wall biosynthesis